MQYYSMAKLPSLLWNVVYSKRMGAPNLSIFSEISLKDLQHSRIINILTKYNRVTYVIYANDILVT
jgi:hypothetical protein